uniref:Uncharacterized protein n=1 Tax=Thermosporothrix sp. COM3 TaxID=2490863 RepID=A0A455SM29_9CHLR|nr:hypothetical protein KTC_27230 [Thermosporothrix sp. COM3]
MRKGGSRAWRMRKRSDAEPAFPTEPSGKTGAEADRQRSKRLSLFDPLFSIPRACALGSVKRYDSALYQLDTVPKGLQHEQEKLPTLPTK